MEALLESSAADPVYSPFHYCSSLRFHAHRYWRHAVDFFSCGVRWILLCEAALPAAACIGDSASCSRPLMRPWPNKPDSANPAMTLWLAIEAQWRRVADLERSATYVI